MKLLIAEDELYAREALVQQIHRCDKDGSFKIFQAANGEEGLEIYRAERPEIVMTDIRMPKMDGLQLLEKIRSESEETKVIMISAFSEFEYARKALMYGAADYLLKPIEDGALAECLEKYIRQIHAKKKEDLLSGQDIITQYVSKRIQSGSVSSFVEERMFQKVFPSFQLGILEQIGESSPEHMLEMLEKRYGSEFRTKLRLLDRGDGQRLFLIDPGRDSREAWERIAACVGAEEQVFRLGISGTHQTSAEIGQSFREAEQALLRADEERPVFFFGSPENVTGNSIVERMKSYAKENYSRDITVKELSEQVLFMNQNYVSHLFSEQTGISFSAYLRRIRIRHAKVLLEEGKWSVSEVAAKVGYNDTSQFIRAFKQETGVTPKKYSKASGN